MPTAAGIAPPRPRQPSERPGPSHRRDPFIDVLRVGAMLMIVAQHWLIPAFSYEDGELVTGNALTTPGAWALTWISQVMPLIFFAGGAAATYSLRSRGGAHDGWLGARLRRLATPAVPLLVIWLPLPHLFLALDVPAGPVDTASRLAGQVLWFLALYVLVTALTPVLLRLHQACRGVEVAGLAASAVVVDIIRFGWFDGADGPGFANVVFVWVAVYQLGIVYASGGLRLRPSRALVLAAAGLGASAAAIAFGPYPGSMLGMPGDPVSNLNPPTAILLGITALQLGLVLALRPAIERWMLNRPVARSVGWLSARLMTIYVWHLPALIAVAGVAVVGFGWATPALLSTEWRTAMPIWVGSLTVGLAVLVRLFGRFEHRGHDRSAVPGRRPVPVSTMPVSPARHSLGVALPPRIRVAGSPVRSERETVGV